MGVCMDLMFAPGRRITAGTVAGFVGAINNDAGLMVNPLSGVQPSSCVHADPILAKDVDGVYQNFPANQPVWVGARVVLAGGAGSDVVSSHSKDILGADILTPIYLQANKAGTNSLIQSALVGVEISLNQRWGAPSSMTTLTANADTSPDGKNDAYEVVFTQNYGNNLAYQYTGNDNAKAVGKVIVKGTLNDRVYMSCNSSVNPNEQILHTFNGEWEEVIFDMEDIGAGAKYVALELYDRGGVNSVGHLPTGLTFLFWEGERHYNTTIEEVKALPPIITTTAARTISATTNNVQAANIDTENSAISIDVKAEDVAFDILTIDGHVLLSYGDTDFGDGVELNVNHDFELGDVNWAKGAGVSIVGGQAVFSGAGNGSILQQTGVISSGVNCVCEIKVSDYVEGSFELRLPLYPVDIVSGDGVFRYYGDSVDTTTLFRSKATPSNFKVDYVSLQGIAKGLILDDGITRTTYPLAAGSHIAQLALGNAVQPELVAEGEFEYPDVWLPHSEWDTSGGEAQITNPTADRSLEQVINPTDGKSHKVKINILELPDTKFLRAVLGGGAFVDFDRVLGVQTKTVIAGSGANLELKPSGSDTGTLRIDSVSVQQVVNKMQLTINGTAEAELDYTPITQGTVEIGATHRDSRIDKERSFADAQAKVLGWQV